MDLIEDSIEDYRNKHQGERVFIVGNGPSLKNTPLNLIKNEYSMAMNRIELIYPETDWRPTYYFQMNSASSRKENLESVQKHIDLGHPCFVNKEFEKELSNVYNNIYYLNIVGTDKKPTYDNRIGNLSDYWSTNIQQKVYKYSTSLHSVVQVAQYMGFKKIYLIGCDLYPVNLIDKWLPEKLISRGSHPFEFDHSPPDSDSDKFRSYIFNFAMEQDNPYSTMINGFWSLMKSNIVDISNEVGNKYLAINQSHFSEEYINKVYNDFKNDKLISANKIISAAAEEYNFECYNASVGGELEVHNRVDLEQIIARSNK